MYAQQTPSINPLPHASSIELLQLPNAFPNPNQAPTHRPHQIPHRKRPRAPPSPRNRARTHPLSLLPVHQTPPLTHPQDIYTNTRPLWHPPGARGIYGGAAIAQSLAAAQLTIPPPSPANRHAVFLIHSMHCYFVLAGDATIPILYHVERVREGKSFMTRTVQARQRGKCIFTTTMSFVREGSGGREVVDHEYAMPEGVRACLEVEGEGEEEGEEEKAANGEEGRGPFVSRKIGVVNSEWATFFVLSFYPWHSCLSIPSSSLASAPSSAPRTNQTS